MFSSYVMTGFILLLSFLSISSILIQSAATAAVDINTSEDGSAAAYDGEGIATNGDSFCSIANDIAGGKFSSSFEGIVGDCDNNSQISNQFVVEYSYTNNPVEIGKKTYLIITVKDKETGNPISNAFVTLAIEHTPSSLSDNIISTALTATTTTPAQEDAHDKTTQTMNTDNNGHAMFTVQLGPKSDMGIYDTEIEVNKDNYRASLEQIDLRVVSQSQQGAMLLKSNNGQANNAIGGDGGDAVGGNAIGGDGGDGGDAVGLALAEPICDETAIGGDGGNGGDTINGIQGREGEIGSDELAIC